MTDLLDTNFMTRDFDVTPIGFLRNVSIRETSPEPSLESVPLTRYGFTRDTTSTEERIVVCPACNDELAYEPVEASPFPSGTSRNSRKRKRALSDHHFWALKKCGHVCAYGFWPTWTSQRPTNTT